MRYSIVIPTYCNKEEQYNNLLSTIDSVRKSEVEDCEIILVDDGSNYHMIGKVNFGEDVRISHSLNQGIPCVSSVVKRSHADASIVE